jgi:predicted nuclease of predicted toxin-antitoxin system
MRFLVDAQLPRRIVWRLRDAGHDAVHTLDLANGNRTSDAEIVDLAKREDRVVVTKDADFVDSHLLRNQPEKLFLISTGNIGNTRSRPSSSRTSNPSCRRWKRPSFSSSAAST